MKIKNKGKVHPSPSSSSSSNDREVVLSVLKLLPAAILTLASVLSLEDREVLAYMITRSLKTPSSSSSSSSSSSDAKKKSSKKAQNSSNNVVNGGVSSTAHKPPMFDCDCFDCYTSYWVRWDSSANRELIHQVIEAFEDHLTNGEKTSKKINGRGKRKDKLGRGREAHNKVAALPVDADGPVRPCSPLPETSSSSTTITAVAPSETTSCGDQNAVVPVSQLEEMSTDGFEGHEEKENDVVEAKEERENSEVADGDVAVVPRTMTASEHKGLARKVLPDVLGLLNSRLWSLWSPNA